MLWAQYKKLCAGLLSLHEGMYGPCCAVQVEAWRLLGYTS